MKKLCIHTLETIERLCESEVKYLKNQSEAAHYPSDKNKFLDKADACLNIAIIIREMISKQKSGKATMFYQQCGEGE